MEPIDTSSRSSKKEKAVEDTSPVAKRKFAPEPIETTSKSSKTKETKQDERKKSRRRKEKKGI